MSNATRNVLPNLRFDLRSPAFGTSSRQLYGESIRMAGYAGRHGFDFVILSEHHGSDDGYNPSPMVLGGAIAARTEQVRINPGTPLEDALRRSGGYAVVTPEQCVELAGRHGKPSMHPLMGGMDPALGWECLVWFVDAVMPELRKQGIR